VALERGTRAGAASPLAVHGVDPHRLSHGVALDTMRQMESQMTLRHHEGFLKG
jgi:hypothetical protein